ncbi:ABC transporter permease [Urechidicola croceus]|uniref:Transmembrane permease n=1 Tax=Urechidicola croceus TaxID=1850246 RepID=A0A1D8P672_9FLAO|nr:FtsX-like permease family protein [Urechidicola croceus]AOW20032.1 transmembrane permease [Urechidicola croceus]
MNYELFLAKRITAAKQHKSSISSPIIKIAIVAIALGIIIMMISIATGVGLQQKIREKISGFNGHIQITNFDNNNSEITLVPVSTTQDFYPKFTNIEGVDRVQVFATKAGIIRTETDFEGVIVKGVGSDYDWSFFKEYLVDGQLPIYTDKRSSEVLLSQYIADRMQFKVGDEFNTLFLKEDTSRPPSIRVFKVVGIYNSGFQDFDENIMIVDIKRVQQLNNWELNQVGGFEVFVTDFEQIAEKNNLIYSEIPSNLNTQAIVHKFPGIFEWIKLFDNNILLIIVIMVFVAGINMITALLVLILERTQMIGILKALGSSNWSIRKIFLYNASHLIVRGLFWGNLIGISILLIQYYFGVIKLNPETYYVKEAPVYFSIGYVLLLNIGTLVLCLIMLIIPSWMVTKISPVKAIKFD